MIKIAHEAPISILDIIREETDYSYALVHLFKQEPEYYEFFKRQVDSGREVILDNSIFELGQAYDQKSYLKWIKKLKPTWYIIPDSLENSSNTIAQAREWKNLIPDLPGKSIGVVQGRTFWELKNCYSFLDEVVNVDMIAISFDYSYYEESVPNPNRLISWMLGRVKLLGDLEKEGIINKQKPHHLLGTALPQEGLFYRDYDWIYSVDTSNPIVHGIQNVQYEKYGLFSKESRKLYELIRTPLEEINFSVMKYNIEAFRDFWNKKHSL